jgi:hypothetical protein
MENPTHRLSCLAVISAHCSHALRKLLVLVTFLALASTLLGATPNSAPPAGLSYTNYIIDNVPWSIHVVLMDRSDPSLEIRSVHAGNKALGMDTLSAQIAMVTNLGVPVAGLNGDFYQRDNAFAGDPRGLQIVDYEVISAPDGGTCFWLSNSGEPHIDTVESRFTVTLPDGTTKPFGLNGALPRDGFELYTPSVGETSHTGKSLELILEKQDGSPWLPLRMQSACTARVREVRQTGNAPLSNDTMILAVGPVLAKTLPPPPPGSVIRISTASLPAMSDAKAAIGGGPALVHSHSKLKIKAAGTGSFEYTSMSERHPRSALGWNQKNLFLVEVDGRQKQLSVGMTLDELGAFLFKLGCDEAVSFDGGGSATLWYDGQVRNSPCDGKERPIANSLIVLRRPKPTIQASSPVH